MVATVRDAAWEGNHLTLRASAGRSEFYAYLHAWPGPVAPEDWLDARLQMTGAGWTYVDGRGRLQSFGLYVTRAEDLEEAAEEDGDADED